MVAGKTNLHGKHDTGPEPEETAKNNTAYRLCPGAQRRQRPLKRFFLESAGRLQVAQAAWVAALVPDADIKEQAFHRGTSGRAAAAKQLAVGATRR